MLLNFSKRIEFFRVLIGIFLGIFVLFLNHPVFSESAKNTESFFSGMTDFDRQMMEEISIFRWKLGLSKTCAEAVAAIDEYSARINDPFFSARISDEILLSMNNILIWEKYNYLYEQDIEHPALEPLIKAQYDVVKKFFREHKKNVHNKWLYTTAGDILSCCMQFLPLPTAMNEGLTIKKYYDDGLEQDPDMVFCLINIAQWYFYAPSINGGGKDKAENLLKHAVECAQNSAEEFLARTLLSQVYFEKKEFEKCNQQLDLADCLLPGSRCVKHYRRINSVGSSYFDYTVNRRKVDKKLRKAGLLEGVVQ